MHAKGMVFVICLQKHPMELQRHMQIKRQKYESGLRPLINAKALNWVIPTTRNMSFCGAMNLLSISLNNWQVAENQLKSTIMKILNLTLITAFIPL
jgi:hypothetical protein